MITVTDIMIRATIDLLLFMIVIDGWYRLRDLLNYLNNYNSKLSRMNLSSIHALTVISFYMFSGSPIILWILSVSYYIVDTIAELNNIYGSSKRSLYDMGILVHHILSIVLIGYLLDESTYEYISYIYFLAEISNLPMYLAYHLIHINYHNKTLIRWITGLEALAFTYCRIYLGTLKVFEIWYISSTPTFILVSAPLLLFISLIWTIKLIVQLKKK